jgi:predicted acylesterase/phospholipase RssA
MTGLTAQSLGEVRRAACLDPVSAAMFTCGVDGGLLYVFAIGGTMNELVARRFKADGPKRILSIDGGGVRGIVAIAFLERIEAVLREQHGNDKLVLSDYFDLIGGTSVGSMIATQLAMGADVATVRERFVEAAPKIFLKERKNAILDQIKKLGWRNGLIAPKFDAGPLSREIRAIVDDSETLSTDRVLTGLGIVMKRADTGSVWPIVNNPSSRYWHSRALDGRNSGRIGNKDYKLWELIRSSTAAPTVFSHHDIEIFEGADLGDKKGHFVDGGVSPYNNPALILFMMAGIKAYNFGGGELEQGGRGWPLGAENLLIISVGTGSHSGNYSAGKLAALSAADCLTGIISDGHDLGLTLLQWMSRPRAPWFIDREIGDLDGDVLGINGVEGAPLLTFSRFDIKLDADELNEERKLPISDGESLKMYRDFTNADNVKPLLMKTRGQAQKQVQPVDFPKAFRR